VAIDAECKNAETQTPQLRQRDEYLMNLQIEIDGEPRTIEMTRDDGRVRWTIDGRAVEADAVEVASGVYSIVIGGQSLEARVEARAGKNGGFRVIVAGQEFAAEVRDPRQWRRHRGKTLEEEGRQQVIAPMPGKIVRVLVKAGETVKAGQGLFVVEAMKMQNEVRSPKSGTVEWLMVMQGQTVNAGETLAVVV
jgi:biotin carboxyl carrier protein